MKKILFPFEIDNPIYKEAYVYAVRIARNLYTEVILLNTFSIDAGNDITKEKYARLIKGKWVRAYNEINKFNQYYLEEHARIDDEFRVSFDHRFIHGILKEEIMKAAKEDNVGLVVLPISDKNELNKRQLEIIRDNVFEKNSVSLLVLPFQGSYRPLNNIIFLTDLKKLNHFKQYVDDVIQFALAFNSKIHFLNISPIDNAEIPEDSVEYQVIKKALAKNNRHIFKRITSKNFLESVGQYVDETQADLLVAIKQQHSFLDSVFHKSQTDELSFHSKVPVLVMREKEF